MLYIPKNIKLITLNNKYIFIYNNFLFLFLNINNNIHLNLNLNILKLKSNNYNNLKFIYFFFNNFLFLWNNFLFNKLYFLGKSFKIKKIKNNIFFNFNQSHIKLFINQKNIIKKINKYKILTISKNYNVHKKIIKIIKNIKNLNLYTKKGIRKAKQIIYIKK